ncbi:MAG: hypothetical protein P8Y71_01505 [Pseudolabrys sp.]
MLAVAGGAINCCFAGHRLLEGDGAVQALQQVVGRRRVRLFLVGEKPRQALQRGDGVAVRRERLRAVVMAAQAKFAVRLRLGRGDEPMQPGQVAASEPAVARRAIGQRRVGRG